MNNDLARFNMVEQQIRPWNVFDEKVLDVLLKIKRENFVESQYANLAFSDVELPLPDGQKMLFPRMEARLLQELKLTKKDKVLEIGTGSGYVTALLAKLSDFVYSVEINNLNQKFAVANLSKNGTKNVTVVSGDGLNGLSSKAPFDKILIGGSIDSISDTLKKQLKVGGILVAIVGKNPIMHAVALEKISETEYSQTQLFETSLDALIAPLTYEFKF